MNRVMLVTTLVGLMATLVVHLLTFVSVDMPRIVPWLLLITFAVLAVPAYGTAPVPSFSENIRLMRNMLRNAPATLRPILIGLLIYLVFIIPYSIMLNGGSSPGEMDGKLVLQVNGTLVELSHEEFAQHVAYENRWISGIALFIYSFFGLYLYTTAKRPQNTNTE